MKQVYRVSGTWGWYEFYTDDERRKIIVDGLINEGYEMVIVSDDDGGREWMYAQTIEKVKRYSYAMQGAEDSKHDGR